MKTAISIPDDVYREAEEMAERLGWSRSQLYARAVSEFVHRQGEDPVTAALDALAGELNESVVPNAGRVLIRSGAWEW